MNQSTTLYRKRGFDSLHWVPDPIRVKKHGKESSAVGSVSAGCILADTGSFCRYREIRITTGVKNEIQLSLDANSVLLNTHAMSITPKAIQDLLDELEASKQSRLRAWNALQRLRSVLSEMENAPIPLAAQKTFDGEGEILEHALTKSLHRRNEAIKSLCWSVRRFRDSTIKAECKSDYPHALQALWKALDRAEDLIQS